MISTDARWPCHAIADLLIVAAGLFVVGVNSENDNDAHHGEPNGETAAAGGHDEAAESAEANEADVEERSTSEADEAAEEDDERVLGIDVESPVAHQLDEDNTGLALLSGAIAALHATAAALALHQATTTGITREPVTS